MSFDKTQSKNVAILATSQALLLINNSTTIALTGLAGHALARHKGLATLPVTGWVVGAALATFPASLLMKRTSRGTGFAVGAVAGVIGATICSAALYLGSFELLCAGAAVLGVYNAFGQYHRFAAAETVGEGGATSRAISLVLAGGLAGGIVGPELSKLTVDLMPTKYLGSYLSLIVFQFAVLLLVRFLDLPKPASGEADGVGRPLSEIVAQPNFIVAVIGAALGYGIMNLLMTATPLAMGSCGHPFGAAAFVIQWHIIAMYAPSFFTGGLIQRFGVAPVMLGGAALLGACVAIALSGVALAQFWLALVLLGIGWNFLYIGGTTLLTATYRPVERAKAQGANDLAIFLTMAMSSFSSGMVLEKQGWATLNAVAVPFVGVIGITVLWLMFRQRATGGATSEN